MTMQVKVVDRPNPKALATLYNKYLHSYNVLNSISLEDLPNYIGKEIDVRQLSDLKDIYIILENIKVSTNKASSNTIVGTLKEYSTNELDITEPSSMLIYNEKEN